MLIGAPVSLGQLSGSSVIGKSGRLARLVILSLVSSVCLFHNQLALHHYLTRTISHESNGDRGEKECVRERGRCEEGLSIRHEGFMPTVSKVIMKWQLWYGTVPLAALITVPFISESHILCN